MDARLRKVRKYFDILDSQRTANEVSVGEIGICPCGYKDSNTPPPLSLFTPYTEGDSWGDGFDSHAWFHFTVHVPTEMRKRPVRLYITSDRTGPDAKNPQFIAYINGALRQGIDTNHIFVELDDLTDADVYVYGYTGPRVASTRFFAKLKNLNPEVEELYYDILSPLSMLDVLDPYSGEYSAILDHLGRAVSLLDLYEVGDEAFFDSVTAADAYLKEEFYGKYCSAERGENTPTVVGIGHTHIDCAWQWTLGQTREKVQRSFATVLELMKRYPEYRFMSSQPLLYQYLKEEAPALYAEVKERIAEGRWECEGAMFVEADCNLPSGESLVRQIVYGKRFFNEEFGKESRVLWLPDVFGYSAAMPQILKKSGVDWFVTSKISWNDENEMPADTFSWVGIDGTAVNAYFLTAQEHREGKPRTITSYNAKTAIKMISGTWRRYHEKSLNNEAMITFGFGDGGGGPTADMLEMGRRAAKGIPGAPLFRQDLAGSFLSRLEKKLENHPRLPKWHGELYLEFHRGTYTSIAKNKRNNRKAEFLFGDAELSAIMGKALYGTPYPKAALREGWELILTNQFHDIIPGSSIREVYEQSDRDYEKVGTIGDGIVSGFMENIASRLDRKGGYMVFNPTSFSGDMTTVVDGVTALVKGLPSKGYKLTKDFVDTNAVIIDGSTVETNIFTVRFDEHMQICSLYDKRCGRELIKEGAKGNELRLYADHPDSYDAWEWQAYSLDEYKVLTDVTSVETVNDGARRGIKVVRTYKSSTVTQTVWFWDRLAKIDFDTTVDWHEHHVFMKTAFPVDINADKATYEIQFGTVERPTHKNTSWDAAKFEVCAHKYADLSEGGYGVSLINDCKYGHDIHDGTITLSLLKSATFPNEVADQGEMCFVYSLCPHEGSFAECDTQRLAYLQNNPVRAIRATGEENSIPEQFSAVCTNRDNVICETVKEAEDGEGTVLRLYESKNRRSRLEIGTDLPFKKAYLCDLLENELSELPVVNGKIETEIGGFEILTVKLKG